MGSPTVRECAVAYLGMMGYDALPSRSRFTLVFNDPRDKDSFLFIGKSTIRVGKSITDSIPVSSTRKKFIVEIGTVILAEELS